MFRFLKIARFRISLAVHCPDLIASVPDGGRGSRRDTVKADLRSVSVNDLYWRGRRDLISGSGGDLALVAVFPADVYLFDTLTDKTSVRKPPDLSIRERRFHLDLLFPLFSRFLEIAGWSCELVNVDKTLMSSRFLPLFQFLLPLFLVFSNRLELVPFFHRSIMYPDNRRIVVNFISLSLSLSLP